MATVKVIEPEGLATYQKYQTQSQAQQSIIELDCRDGSLSATYDPEIGNACPVEVIFGHVQRFDIPTINDECAMSLLSDISPIAQRIVDGYESEFDGHNHVARFTSDAESAIEETSEICSNVESELNVWDAGDWFDENPPDVKWWMSDDELCDLEQKLDQEIEESNEVDFVDGIEEYLSYRRDGEILENLSGIFRSFVENFDQNDVDVYPSTIVCQWGNFHDAGFDEEFDIWIEPTIGHQCWLDNDRALELVKWLVENKHVGKDL